MTKRHIFLFGSTFLWLIVIAVVIKTSLDSLSVPAWGSSAETGRSPEIAGTVQVGQQFVAPYPGLYRIEVWLDPATATSPHRVDFHLKGGPNTALDLLTASFQTTDLENGVPYHVEFGPFGRQKGQDYYFYFESPDSAPGDAITAHYSPEAVLAGANAMVNGQPAPGNLRFYTFYSLRTRDKLDLLLTRMADGRPYLLGEKGYYLALALVYILLLVAFLWQVAHAVLGNERR